MEKSGPGMFGTFPVYVKGKTEKYSFEDVL